MQAELLAMRAAEAEAEEGRRAERVRRSEEHASKSRLYLGHLSAVSRLSPGCLSAISRLSLGSLHEHPPPKRALQL